MQISKPNEHGVLAPAAEEIVAQHGRSYAAVRIALGEDGRYRQSVSLMYSYGGFSGPISIEDTGYALAADAWIAGLEELLRRWHSPFPSDPRSVHEELAEMHRQIVTQFQQPLLL